MKSFSVKNYNFSLNKGDIIAIVGNNNSGKTFFLENIIGKIKNNNIFIDDININKYSISYKKKNIVCIFNNNLFNTTNSKDELEYYLKYLNIYDIDIINDFIIYFKLSNIINKSFKLLTTSERIYIKILSFLIINPSIICIDDLLTYLDNEMKLKIINYIKNKNISLIYVTTNKEELLFSDKIMILNNNKNIMFDYSNIVLKNNNILEENGVSVPFIYNINNLLLNYNLINDYHLVKKELVEYLWK